MVNNKTNPKLGKEAVDKMQEQYYKEHKTKFPNIVNIWNIGKTEYLDSVERELKYIEKYNQKK